MDVEELRIYNRDRARRWREKYPEKWKAADRKWKAANRDKMRAGDLARKVRANGLPPRFDACYCCLRVDPDHSYGWAIDHCRSRFLNRGILCQRCNSSEGKMSKTMRRMGIELDLSRDVPDEHYQQIVEYLRIFGDGWHTERALARIEELRKIALDKHVATE